MIVKRVGYDYRHKSDFRIKHPDSSGYNLLVIFRSKAYIEMHEKRLSVEPDSVIIFRKSTQVFYGGWDVDFRNDWIQFEMSDSDEAEILNLNIEFDTLIKFDNVAELSDTVKKIYREIYSENMYKEKSMALYMELLMIKLSENQNRYIEYKKLSTFYEKLSVLRTRIYNKPWDKWIVGEVCNELNMSESYFQHSYKDFFGRSFIDDVINSRITYGKYLLKNTDYTVKQIAYETGYKDDAGFIHQFKSRTNLTPGKYRKIVQS